MGEKERFPHAGGQKARCSGTQCTVWAPKAPNAYTLGVPPCDCQPAVSDPSNHSAHWGRAEEVQEEPYGKQGLRIEAEE